MASLEEKKSDDAQSPSFKGESLSKFLLKMYRMAYGSMSDEQNQKQIDEKWGNLVKEIKQMNKDFTFIPSTSVSISIVNAISVLLSATDNKYIYGQKDATIEDKKFEPRVKLIEYCMKDNIDQALLILLRYKLENKSCKDMFFLLDLAVAS